MNPTPGEHTSEYRVTVIVTAITQTIAAVMTILVFYGIFTQNESDLWIAALIAVINQVAAVWKTANYTRSRATVKAAAAASFNPGRTTAQAQ